MTGSKSELYRDLTDQLAALLAGEADLIANAAALVYHGLPDLNWAGFYFRHGAELVLGPFQGKPACVRIPKGKGVCGTSAARAATVLVPDVHDFPGHIACDPNSRSELVVPLIEAVASSECSTSTVRLPRALTKPIGKAASAWSPCSSITFANIRALGGSCAFDVIRGT